MIKLLISIKKNKFYHFLIMSGPDVWGPHGWKFIHYITLGYPNNPTDIDKKQYYEFFNSLKNVIPCSICGSNYKKHLQQIPLTDDILSNKIKFVYWGINMHNLTNKENGKKTYTLNEGFREVKKKSLPYDCDKNIERFIHTSNSIYKNPMFYIIVIIIMILCFIIYRLYFEKRL